MRSFADNNSQAVTSDFIIYTCVIQIKNKLKSTSAIKNALIFFSNFQGLKIVRPSLNDVYNAVELMESSRLDFDDSLVVSAMKSNNVKELASLDRDFDRIKGIERIKI